MVRIILVTALAITGGLLIHKSAATAEDATTPERLPELPTQLPESSLGNMSLPLDEQRERPLTLVPEIQNHLSRFIRDKGSPIAAVVIADVKTGRILALTQGRSPERWGGQTHTALHAGFPAASLFKTTVTAAAFEFADVNSSAPIGLVGGCSHVHPTGMWMREDKRQGPNAMTLKRAYGHSCNGFFAKLAINRVGLGPILTMARRLGWDAVPPHLADFKVPPSPLHPPNAETSSAYTVGRFAAGFGSVGLSPVHAIWQSLIVANDGVAYPLSIFVDTPSPQESGPSLRVMTPETALKIRQVMDATVLGGTASGTFRNPRYARLRRGFGGKTGTLTGTNPEGLTTWFTGIYPLDHPEVVVSSVVILEDLWLIKATTLAAEAVAAYFDYKHSGDPITTAQVGPKRKFSRLNR